MDEWLMFAVNHVHGNTHQAHTKLCGHTHWSFQKKKKKKDKKYKKAKKDKVRVPLRARPMTPVYPPRHCAALHQPAQLLKIQHPPLPFPPCCSHPPIMTPGTEVRRCLFSSGVADHDFGHCVQREDRREEKANLNDQFGKYGFIRPSEKFHKQDEFRAWLSEHKQVDWGMLQGRERDDMWAEFAEDFNTATLPHVSVARTLTPHPSALVLPCPLCATPQVALTSWSLYIKFRVPFSH